MFIRKDRRLDYFNYNALGPYFITICTYNRQKLFGNIQNNKFIYYSDDLKILFDNTYKAIENEFKGIQFNVHCTMPDHVHFIVLNETSGRIDLGEIIKRFKILILKGYQDLVYKGKVQKYTGHLWQKNFYDHIIRNEREFDDCYEYIVNNPMAASFKVLLAKWNRESEEQKRRLKARQEAEDAADIELAMKRLKGQKEEDLISQEEFEKKFGIKFDEIEPLDDDELE